MSSHLSSRSGKFVVPGNKLGVIEELVPGQGTYVDDGNIYALTTGNALVDLLERRVAVLSEVQQPLVPRIDSVVSGVVNNVQENSLEIRIMKIDGKSVSGFFTGVLHISNVSDRFVKTMFDAFKPGDLVDARVISTTNRVFHLTTEEPKLGVVYAFCSYCGSPLKYKDRALRCLTCRRIENRKTASGYGKL